MIGNLSKIGNILKCLFLNVDDHTIVPLEIEEYDDPEGDYINANYITVRILNIFLH